MVNRASFNWFEQSSVNSIFWQKMSQFAENGGRVEFDIDTLTRTKQTVGASELAIAEQRALIVQYLSMLKDVLYDYFAESFDQPAQQAGMVYMEPVVPVARRHFGSAKGLIVMADDFDEPLADFNVYLR